MPNTRKEVDPLKSLASTPADSKPPAKPAGPDPRELAKILAKAATARAAASAPKPAPIPQARPAEPARPAGIHGAPPPTRKLSASEAMEAARRAEEAPPAPRALAPVAPPPTITLPPPPGALLDRAQVVIQASYPGATIYVAGAWYAEDRRLLTAVWKAHRARFSAAWQLDAAAAAGVVLTALAHVAGRELIAIHGVTDRGDYLVFADLGSGAALAAFAGARSLISGLEGAT